MVGDWSGIAPDHVSEKWILSFCWDLGWSVTTSNGRWLSPITPAIKEINESFWSGMIGNFWSYNNLDITQKVEAFVHYTY